MKEKIQPSKPYIYEASNNDAIPLKNQFGDEFFDQNFTDPTNINFGEEDNFGAPNPEKNLYGASKESQIINQLFADSDLAAAENDLSHS